MTYRDMSLYVTTIEISCHNMSYQLSRHVIICHNLSKQNKWKFCKKFMNIITCHDMSWYVMTTFKIHVFNAISNCHDMSWYLSWHIITYHGMSWWMSILYHDMSRHIMTFIMTWRVVKINGTNSGSLCGVFYLGTLQIEISIRKSLSF